MNFPSLVSAPMQNDSFQFHTICTNKIAESPTSEAGTTKTQFPSAS